MELSESRLGSMGVMPTSAEAETAEHRRIKGPTSAEIRSSDTETEMLAFIAQYNMELCGLPVR